MTTRRKFLRTGAHRPLLAGVWALLACDPTNSLRSSADAERPAADLGAGGGAGEGGNGGAAGAPVPSPDAGPTDARVTDAAGNDAAGNDAQALDAATPDAEAPDALHPDAQAPDADHVCALPEPGDAPEPPTLANAAALPPIEMGGPAALDQVLLTNLDGDPGDVLELVIVRGGRVMAARPDGRVLWQSEAFSARYLGDVADFNGDGRRDVIARSARDVRIFDALTGVERWRIPAGAIGPDRPEILGVQRLAAGDVDADGLPDVQVADAGCGSNDGTGASAFYSFAGAHPDPATGAWLDVRPLAIVPSPSRCGRWQTQGHFGADGPAAPAEIIVPTRVGMLGVDPVTAEVRHCIDGLAEFNGQSLNRVIDLDGDGSAPEVVVFTLLRTLAYEVTNDPAVGGCAAGTLGFRLRWEAPVSAARGERAAFLATPGAPLLAISAFDDATSQWTTTALDGATGAIRAQVPDLLLLGPAELDADAQTAEVLAFTGAGRSPAGFGDLHALRWNAGASAFDTLWTKADAAPFQRRHPAREADRPIDFRDSLSIDGRAVVVRHDPVTQAAIRLESVAADGSVFTYDVTGEPSGADVACEGPCRLAVALTDGRLALFDAALTLLNPAPDAAGPALSAPTGTHTLVAALGPAGDALIATTTTGWLGRVEPVSGPVQWAWSVPLGNGEGSGRPVPLAIPGTLGQVARRDYRSGPVNAWAFFDADTGERLGEHTYDADAVASLGESVALDVNDDGREDLIRLDRNVAPSAPDDRCPARDVQERLVTAVDGATYATLWQTALRPADPCRGATSERVNVARLNGAPTILVTESNSIRRLEPTTGVELDRADIDDLPSSNRGGGWMLSTGLDEPAFLRVGGNGPIEARNAELDLVWRAADDLAPGPRSWLGRPAVVVGRQVWISPAPGFAAVQLGLDGPTAGQVEGTIRLGGGAELAPDAPGQAELSNWLPAHTLSAQVDAGVLVNGADGFIYALREDGALVFARAYADTPGRPVVADVDDDGVPELVAAVADGTVIISDNAGQSPPQSAWDVPCPEVAQCAPEADIDTTTDTARLCAEWYPAADADGYFVRVVGPNGAPVSDWQDAGDRPVARIDDLELVPGALYCVEVRAWRQPGAHIELSPPVVTDCVLVLDETPPTVDLQVPDPTWATGDAPMDIRLVAHDAEGLAAWRIELLDATGRLFGVLDAGAAQGTDWTVDRTFQGRDVLGKAIPPGEFTLRGVAQDEAGVEAAESVAITLCSEPCP